MAKQTRKQWNEQELQQLFAERLPVLDMPDNFLERLTESVLNEVQRHVEQRSAQRGAHATRMAPVSDIQQPTHGNEQAATVAAPCSPRCQAPKCSLPPL